MARIAKPNDLQLILLSHAARHGSRNVMPLPDSVTDQLRADKELKSLLRRGLLCEAETVEPSEAWRSDGDSHVALLINDPGLAVLGLGEGAGQEGGKVARDPAGAAQPLTPAKPRADSKIAKVIALLKRGEGATLAELVAATGWQPHTTRAALTGLRKKGHVITKGKRGEVTCYRIAEPA